MTIIDIKHLDKRLREITDPFGTGFPIVKKLFAEAAHKHDLTVTGLVRKYLAWEWSK